MNSARFGANLLMTIGVLLAGFTGYCTLAFTSRGIPTLIYLGLVVGLGVLPFLLGVWLFWKGIGIANRLNRKEKDEL